MLGGHMSTEKENSRQQSPLPSSTRNGNGRENGGCEGVSILLFLRMTACSLYQLAIKPELYHKLCQHR